jgi:LuxR family transcriptional regulator, maltose regulon positive regulatory protein
LTCIVFFGIKSIISRPLRIDSMENKTINTKETQYPLLETKLYIPPPRPDLVQRTHLIDRLSKGIDRKLTLISAPAGFGKTTLLSEWIFKNDTPVAWISLDKGDNDPFHFIHYLIAALQKFDSNTGKTTLAMLQSPQQQPIESIMTSLSREISEIPINCVLVLDDYHCVDTKQIHNMVESLLDYLPAQLRLVIATRVDPPLPLARMRVRNQLNELRTADLCFTYDEAAQFLKKVMNLGISSHDISVLESRTEGWIAGLQLAALSMQGRKDISAFINAFAGDDRHVIDYLAEEVLNQQSEQVQKFLLQTSILNRLSGSLCDFVTGQKNGQEMLVDLDRANLFIISLDDKRCWYRYHHLFADLLQQRLQQTNSALVPELHCRASEWYSHNELIKEAIEHALMAEDFKRAARLLEELAEAIWQRGEPIRLFQWIKALPDEYLTSRPDLCIFYAWDLVENGQHQAAEQSLQMAERIIDPANNKKMIKPAVESAKQHSLTNRKLQGRIAAIRAYMATFWGDIQSIVKFSEEALECLHKGDSAWRAGVAIYLGIAHTFKGDNVSAVKALSEAVAASKAAGNMHLYLVANFWLIVRLKYHGQLSRAIDICKHLFSVVTEEKLTNTELEGGLFAIWGELLYELNELDEALHYEKKGLILVEQGHHVGSRGWAYFCLLKILSAKQDFSEVEEVIRKIERLERSSDLPLWVTHQTEAWKARTWLMQGELDRVVDWAQGRGLRLDDDLIPVREAEHIIFARILIAQGRLNDASGLLERLSREGEKGGRILSQIETLLVRALVLWTQRNRTEALIIFGKALSLAEPGGYIRIFLDEGPVLSELLEKILDAKTGVPRAYVKKLLSAFRVNKLIRTDDGLVERLSERELEVLRLIAAGLPNKKITEELFISLSTVKTHLRNIYGKLNVHRRTEAVAKAKELELL